MIKYLVGYTGFVGSNIAKSATFEGLFNSKNVNNAFGCEPDLLVYSGVKAEKFLANKDPEADYECIKNAISNIQKINPQKIVLISTIDVYKTPIGTNEDSVIDPVDLHPYGLNRYRLEKWVEENISDHLIVRLPGLYGENIKKNFIFDLINVIPSMLSDSKYEELLSRNNSISSFYIKQDNGFFKCKELNAKERKDLKEYFIESGFSALNFTDSRGVFQFYNLSYLWGHIETGLAKGVKKLNLAVEPVSASEVYDRIKGSSFVNEIAENPPKYDFRTKHAEMFSGKNGYIFNKEFVLNDIKSFIDAK